MADGPEKGEARDVSEILLVHEKPCGETQARSLPRHQRIFHERALGLAAAYAIREGIETVMWIKNEPYASVWLGTGGRPRLLSAPSGSRLWRLADFA